ncbi:MAG: hypothetical protein JW794_01355 [Candidatus Cloacimonetes bacterium]|nr:hypothetical protein [Candidatus Cloacimonadota bacterium]
MNIEKLIQGNKDFIRKFSKEKELYLKLATKGQSPKVLWIGCSDSRVVPEFIVNAKAGELFVVRNIANIVPPQSANDRNMSTILEYAILHLKVEHIVICGHTCCGGITSLVKETSSDSNISAWLRYARPALSSKKDTSESIKETIENNILLQVENLLSYDLIRKNQKNIKIHKWLYDIHTGALLHHDDNINCWKFDAE